jgi:dTDP-4-amino-4,6-dideoxygalactose transaminase
MKVPFADLSRLHNKYKTEFLAAMNEVVESSSFIGGNAVTAFEREFADYVGRAHCVSCNSGYDALYIALKALELPADARIIVPAMSYAASSFCISNAGYTPMFVDVCPTTGLIDVNALEMLLQTETAHALIVVHLYGQPILEMDRIMALANTHKLQVIEDCAQAHGVQLHGRHVGYHGAISTYSFYPGKNLGALGDGGCLVTVSAKLADTCRVIANLGAKVKYVHDALGINSRLDNLQARILSIKLRDLDSHNAQRKHIGALYRELLGDIAPLRDPVVDTYHVYYILTASSDERAKLQAFLSSRNIDTNIHYPISMNKLGYYTMAGVNVTCPNAEEFATRCLSLPMFPGMTDEETHAVASAIKLFYAE